MNVLLTQYLEIPVLKRKEKRGGWREHFGRKWQSFDPKCDYLFEGDPQLAIVLFVTAHKPSFGQGNIFRSVCQEFCLRGEEYLGRYPRGPGRYTPQPDSYSPRPGRYTPLLPGRYPLGTRQVHSPGTRQVPRPSSTCLEIRATSGRYASYWNAFLLWGNSKMCSMFVQLFS